MSIESFEDAGVEITKLFLAQDISWVYALHELKEFVGLRSAEFIIVIVETPFLERLWEGDRALIFRFWAR